jgi:hypothetical protein
VFIFENMAGRIFIVPITDSVLILEFCKFRSCTIWVGPAENKFKKKQKSAYLLLHQMDHNKN